MAVTGDTLTDDPVSRLLALFRDVGHLDYIGEPVSQLEHAAQAADCALAEGHEDAVVCAAFLHDVGHLCAANAERMGAWGTAGHETLGARFLRELGFGERVARLVAGHVAAKRYLTFKQPEYYRRLSQASKATLRYQGGPMTAAEARDFEADPLFSLILELRTWDEAAKLPGQPVVALARFEVILRRHWEAVHATAS
jgi:phosphonate degradation associated HDIG domain protein